MAEIAADENLQELARSRRAHETTSGPTNYGF